MASSFHAALSQFEGPLDLMLHLVKESKLDLFNLDLDQLAGQYIDYIRQQKDLDLASEYLVEFSRLLEYKSMKLMPFGQSEEEQENLQDEYSRRLVEYKIFKEAAKRLEGFYETASQELGRPTDPIFYELQNLESNVLKFPGIEQLSRIFHRSLKRSRLHMEKVLPERELNIDDIYQSLQERLIPGREYFLEEILGWSQTRLECIVTFMAVLELICRKEMDITGDKLVYGQKITD